MQNDINAIEREGNNDIRKYNILDILNNIGSIFTSAYLHYKDCLKTQFLEEISQREQI